ncbi:hypothetical protein [Alkalicoccus halolimnae]|uniref:Cytochrome-c oxidase n=1 Tax=Alkalicoccus halolimnae TaxID=1667239 RepID=A0A5C7F3Q4_9BACI|nr:hypothetical protein [Alkalicoccus halolimnae]TXF83930.1 hypothetical protein FTX54_11610 [Alkalicoccus halolimnae]
MSHSKMLLIAAAVFGVIGTFMGGHMAGSGSPALRPIHAHVLVVGWLTLFSWAIYYKVYKPKKGLLTTIHVWTGLIGTIGLCSGMYVFMMDVVPLPELFTLLYYIISGTVLTVSFFLFLVIAIKTPDDI